MTSTPFFLKYCTAQNCDVCRRTREKEKWKVREIKRNTFGIP